MSSQLFRDALRKLNPLVGNARVNHLWRAYLASDADTRRELERMVEMQVAQLLREDAAGSPAGLFPPPPRERALGSIEIGKVKYGGSAPYAFGFRNHELLRHLGVYGSSGSGKSNAIALIVDGLMRERVPFILVDFKRTFRSLLKDYKNLLVFTAGDHRTAPFRFNPLIPPPGVTTDVFLKRVTGGALAHSFCLGAGADSCLTSALMESYRQAAREKRWPTFHDVARILEQEPARGRKGLWLDSAKRAVKSLTTGNAAEVFCPKHPIAIPSLFRNNVILELELLSQSEQTFAAESLLLWLLYYQMMNEKDRETLKLAFIIEEAHHLLNASMGIGDGSEPVLHTALRETRELGVAIFLATQNPSTVPVSVFGNQANTIVLHTQNATDIRAVSNSLVLKDEAKEELVRLNVGEALVRASDRWRTPIHVALTFRPLAKGQISDEDIRRHMAGYFQNTATDSPPSVKQSGFQEIPVPDEIQVQTTEPPFRETIPRTPSIVSCPPTTPDNQIDEVSNESASTLERTMLMEIVAHPFDGVVRRIHRLQTSRRKGVAALKALEARQLVRPVPVFIGSSVIKLYDLTSTGRALCQQLGGPALPSPTQGGVEHRYWVHCVAANLRSQGWETATEYPVTPELILDIHASKAEQRLAVLVETGKSHVADNIERTVKAGFDTLWVVSNAPSVTAIVKHAKQTNPNVQIQLFPTSLFFLKPIDVVLA